MDTLSNKYKHIQRGSILVWWATQAELLHSEELRNSVSRQSLRKWNTAHSSRKWTHVRCTANTCLCPPPTHTHEVGRREGEREQVKEGKKLSRKQFHATCPNEFIQRIPDLSEVSYLKLGIQSCCGVFCLARLCWIIRESSLLQSHICDTMSPACQNPYPHP